MVTGCGGGASNQAGNVAANGANNPLQTATPATDQVTNNAPTLTPVVKAYCAAMIKKDDAAIRKIYSRDTVKNFEAQMKEQKIKNLVTFLEDDKVSENLCEASNERIKGDTAIAKIQTDGYPKGIDVFFVKEDGEWKFTNENPVLDARKPAANSSNAAK